MNFLILLSFCKFSDRIPTASTAGVWVWRESKLLKLFSLLVLSLSVLFCVCRHKNFKTNDSVGSPLALKQMFENFKFVLTFLLPSFSLS